MTLKTKKYALITGGSGFLGTNLAKRFLKEKRKFKILDLQKPQVKNVQFVKGDITKLDDVLKAAKNVDVIFHLASPVPQSKTSKDIYEKVIIGGTENILRACKKYKIKMVHISSSGVYGSNRSGVLKEDDEKRPYEGYGESKWESEKLCCKYARDGVDVTIIRPTAMIGPDIGGLFKLFMKFVYYNLPLITIGKGENKIQMLSASDCIDAMLKAEKYDKSGEVFNIGSDNVPAFKDQLRIFLKKVGSKSIIIPLPSYPTKKFFEILHKINLTFFPPEHYEMLDKNVLLNTNKAKSVLRWKPKKDNIQMMVEAYEWFKENI